ncbi:type II toxin-antitoxin system RelE family toxin [Persephonella sp.]
MYRLVFEKQAEKEFLSLPRHIQRIIREKLLILSQNPEVLKNNIKPLKGKYKGLKRLRVGRYRIIFQEKEEELIILIVRVAHRKESY